MKVLMVATVAHLSKAAPSKNQAATLDRGQRQPVGPTGATSKL